MELAGGATERTGLALMVAGLRRLLPPAAPEVS